MKTVEKVSHLKAVTFLETDRQIRYAVSSLAAILPFLLKVEITTYFPT